MDTLSKDTGEIRSEVGVLRGKVDDVLKGMSERKTNGQPSVVDPTLSKKVDEIASSLTELKARDTGLTAAWIAAVAALIGAFLAAIALITTTRWTLNAGAMRAREERSDKRIGALEERLAASIAARDELLAERRMAVYSNLFAKFKHLPREQKSDSAVSAMQLQALPGHLRDWYYEDGGGLVMSDLCKSVFDACSHLINDGGHERLREHYYDAAYYCCSKLRTACIHDLDGRRELGAAPDDRTRGELNAFVERVATARRGGQEAVLEFMRSLATEQNNMNQQVAA